MSSESVNARFARLVEVATDTDMDEHSYWGLVDEIRTCGPVDEVFALVLPLATSDEEHRRVLVPAVLRLLGGRERPKREETVEVLQSMLGREADASVLAAIAGAFIDLEHPAAAELLSPLLAHEDKTVRLAAVHGLLPFADRVVPELIAVTRDPSDDVRSWASFTIANLPADSVTPEADLAVRDALGARLDDPHAETRAEAILGLARRGDRRAMPALLRELGGNPEWDHVFEAAELFGDTSLHPALSRLAESGRCDRGLAAALEACAPDSSTEGIEGAE